MEERQGGGTSQSGRPASQKIRRQAEREFAKPRRLLPREDGRDGKVLSGGTTMIIASCAHFFWPRVKELAGLADAKVVSAPPSARRFLCHTLACLRREQKHAHAQVAPDQGPEFEFVRFKKRRRTREAWEPLTNACAESACCVTSDRLLSANRGSLETHCETDESENSSAATCAHSYAKRSLYVSQVTTGDSFTWHVARSRSRERVGDKRSSGRPPRHIEAVAADKTGQRARAFHLTGARAKLPARTIHFTPRSLRVPETLTPSPRASRAAALPGSAWNGTRTTKALQ